MVLGRSEARGICCLHLDNPSIVRTTEVAFMVQPVEARCPLFIAVIAEYVLGNYENLLIILSRIYIKEQQQ